MTRNPKEHARFALVKFSAEFFFEVLKGEHQFEGKTLPDKFRIVGHTYDEFDKVFCIKIESDELPEVYLGQSLPVVQLVAGMRRKTLEQQEAM